MADEDDSIVGLLSRRRYLQAVGALAGATFGTTSAAAASRKGVPTPYRKWGARLGLPNDVFVTHVSELPTVENRIASYNRTHDVEYVVSPQLRRLLDERSSGTIDLTVNTRGERTSVRTRGQYRRAIHGWRPTAEEISALSGFGEILYVPEVSSTKVGLSNVEIADIPTISALEFVLDVGHDPELGAREPANTGVSVRSNSRATPADLRSSRHMDFDSAVYDSATLPQIGIIGGGYTSETDWSEPWADVVGIDTTKATDFIGDDWTTGTTHGTNVADTVAYLLKDDNVRSDLVVPLQVYEPDYGLVKGSVMRSAIEYALLNDIAVVNISVETAEHERRCPGTVCEELSAYTSAGYLAVVATGNDSIEKKVCHPATSHFSLSVGGYSERCSGGYRRNDRSNYGQIEYYDAESGTVFCPWCYQSAGADEFQPNVYACYTFDTDAGTSIGGTSFSAPIVAAAGAIRHSVCGPDSYADKLADFNNMTERRICEPEASRQGAVLHVPDLT
jgi:hypothetical protein